MARHVGRPTNEEVAARKRKQMLKILIPVGLVTIVAIMIIGGTGLRGLMGASIDECSYECEEGWTADKNNICYLDIEDSTKNLSAYILGDANNDGVMNAQDFDLLNNDITNGVELDSVKESIYDINQDGEVNAEDIIAFNENISSMSTVGVVSNQILVCPKETITNEQDEEGNEITVTTNYELNNNQCIAKIKKEKQAKKVCTGVEGTGFYFTDTDNDDNVSSLNTSSKSGITIKNVPDSDKIYQYGDRIQFNVIFSTNVLNKYMQYKAYYDDTKMNFISECKKIETKTISPSLSMNKTNRKIVFQIYSDNKCKETYGDSVSTETYKMEADNISGIKKTLNTDDFQYIINNSNNIAKLYYSKTKEVENNQKLEFVGVFEKLNKDYYYQFTDTKDGKIQKGHCMKIVSGMNILHTIQANARENKISIAMYSDKKCNNMISGTEKSVNYTNKNYSNVKDNGDIRVSIDNKVKSQQLKYGSVVTSVATFKTTGTKKFYYKLRTYGDNKLNSESRCYLVKNGNISTAKLKMNSQNRYAKWTIYEDVNCTKPYNLEKLSNIYKLDEASLSFIKKEKLSDISFSYENLKVKISQPVSKFMEKNEKFRLRILFNLNNSKINKQKYYKITIYKNKKITNTSNCNLIVDNLQSISSITMDSSTLYGKIDIYDNYKCSGKPVTSETTKKYTYKPSITLSPSKQAGKYNIGTEIKIGASAKVYDDSTYYYKVNRYNNNKTIPSNTSKCLAIKNGSDISRTLTINTDTAKLVWELYNKKDSNGNCVGKISSVSSPQYNSIKTFTIDYNSNGGKGSMGDTTVTYGKEQTLRKNNFTRSGYYFKYWTVYNVTRGKWLCYENTNKTTREYTSKSTCEKYGYVPYKDGQTVSKTAKAGEKIRLYAQWQYLYNDTAIGFNGFEKDPTSGSTKATIWPVINLTIYKDKELKSSTGKTVPQAKALFVLDMTNKKNMSNSHIKIKYGNTTGWINGEYVMINLPDVIPSIEYNITNAKQSAFKNHGKSLYDKYGKITGEDIYAGSWYGYNKRLGYKEYLAPVRLQTAKMIQRAQKTALKHNNCLKIYDLFRPYSAQNRVASALSKVKFSEKQYCVSNKFDPSKNSNGSTKCITDSYGWFIATSPVSHNVGKALDVTLIDTITGKEISTQTNAHELSNESIPTSAMIDRYPGELALNHLFVKSGFHYLISEWWHFEDMGRKPVYGVERLGSSDSGKSLKLSYWDK